MNQRLPPLPSRVGIRRLTIGFVLCGTGFALREVSEIGWARFRPERMWTYLGILKGWVTFVGIWRIGEAFGMMDDGSNDRRA